MSKRGSRSNRRSHTCGILILILTLASGGGQLLKRTQRQTNPTGISRHARIYAIVRCCLEIIIVSGLCFKRLEVSAAAPCPIVWCGINSKNLEQTGSAAGCISLSEVCLMAES